MRPLYRNTLLVLFLGFGIFAGAHAAQAGCTFSFSPTSGPAPTQVNANFAVSLPGGPVEGDISWGDGVVSNNVCTGNNSCSGNKNHTYSQTSQGRLYGFNSGTGATCTSPFRTFTVTGGGGGNWYQCADGIDNDGDGDIDYGSDCGCTSPFDSTESTANCGGQPNWVHIIVDAPPGITWRIFCPPGSYGCKGWPDNAGVGFEQSGPTGPFQSDWVKCKNNACALQQPWGTYTAEPLNDGGSCANVSKTISWGTHSVYLKIPCGGGGGSAACTMMATPNIFVIPPMKSSLLEWDCEDTSNCSVDQGIGPVSESGSTTVSPTSTTTYTVSCTDNGGASAAATVQVYQFSAGDLREIKPQQ